MYAVVHIVGYSQCMIVNYSSVSSLQPSVLIVFINYILEQKILLRIQLRVPHCVMRSKTRLLIINGFFVTKMGQEQKFPNSKWLNSWTRWTRNVSGNLGWIALCVNWLKQSCGGRTRVILLLIVRPSYFFRLWLEVILLAVLPFNWKIMRNWGPALPVVLCLFAQCLLKK